MLDIDTLRFAQAAVAVCSFSLVFFGTYLPTRAPYAGWWALVVVTSSAASGMYLLADLPMRLATDALGNALAVLGASCVWAATRSLGGRGTRAWQLALAPAAVLAASLFDGRSDDVIRGTGALLVGMGAMFGLAAYQLWALAHQQARTRDEAVGDGTRAAVLSVTIASTCLAVLYALRIVAFVVLGPAHPFYATWTGPTTTTAVIMLAMVAVTYSVTELSRYELADSWRLRALRDDLTGLLTRGAFDEQAEAVLADAAHRRATPVLVTADFDHFKEVNDRHGHAAGDRVLSAFGDACRGHVRDGDLVGRRGGEEFAILLRHGDAASARALSRRVGDAVADQLDEGFVPPTLSFGIAVVRAGETLESVLLRADDALYAAKSAGRDRANVHGEVTAQKNEAPGP